MKLAYEMEYMNPVYEKSTIELVPYSSIYQEQYKKIYNECYHEMREALEIEPYDFIQDDSFFETGMDKVYILFDKEDIIGSVALKDSEIDDLIVNRKYQGLGYGRQILLWALEHINAEKVILHVADWNEKAVRLYKNNGFQITNTIVIG